MERFISPTAMLERAVTPDLLYSVGITLPPDQERALLGKLKLVLGRRIARVVLYLLSPAERSEMLALSEYASREAVQRWLEVHVPGLPDLLHVERQLLKTELLRRAAEIQASKGERGIPDWSNRVTDEAA